VQLLGAVPTDAGQVEFRVWAPSAGHGGVRLVISEAEIGDDRPLEQWGHVAQAIAEATREGRRREFESFSGFSGEVPDPQAEETFHRSKLSRREVPGLRDHYRRLLERR
jgi:maltooligosyltrehalose trehalohydrolase